MFAWADPQLVLGLEFLQANGTDLKASHTKSVVLQAKNTQTGKTEATLPKNLCLIPLLLVMERKKKGPLPRGLAWQCDRVWLSTALCSPGL